LGQQDWLVVFVDGKTFRRFVKNFERRPKITSENVMFSIKLLLKALPWQGFILNRLFLEIRDIKGVTAHMLKTAKIMKIIIIITCLFLSLLALGCFCTLMAFNVCIL